MTSTPHTPVLDVLDISFGEALGIYLYAHRQIEDPCDVGQAEIVRRYDVADENGHAACYAADIIYRTRGADSRTAMRSITPSADQFAFELQQTLARYAAGLVDAEVRGND